MSVAENIISFRSELPAHVTLVAVSKTKPVEMIMEAYNAGQCEFGENYVQELTEKHEKLPEDIRWHFIGHLQSNKVKYIAPFVHLIHGVDSLKLLKEINKQALKNNRVIDCLLQMYIATEETKFGFNEEECATLLASEEFGSLNNVNVCGLMGMASNTDNETQIRAEFRSLRSIKENLSRLHSDLKILSMGMSSDYKIAIEEGSTMLRVGSTIFGERDYTKK
jgi:PLP dependent protein